VRTGTSIEAEALALLGLSSVAARMSMASPVVSDEVADAMFDVADVDTIVDWAERRLPRKPADGKVAERIAAMDADLRAKVAAEVACRPEPLELCPELAMCLPGIGSQPVPAKAARPARVVLQRILGDDPEAWERFVASLGDPSRSLVELADAAAGV
jgi:hypothetical protein